MQTNDEILNFYDADENPYTRSSLDKSFSDSRIFQELTFDDEICNDEQTYITYDSEIKRILKKAQILQLPEDDTASLSLSLKGAVELLKSEIVERSLNKEERLILQKALPSYAQMYLIEQAVKHRRTLSIDETSSRAQMYLQNWLYKIGSRFNPQRGPQNITRHIPDDIYDEAIKLERAVCNLKIRDDGERVSRPVTTAQAYLMSSMAPPFVKDMVGSNEIAFNEAVKALGIIATDKQNKAVQKLDDQALVFYVALMRICVKYACSQKAPLAFLRYRITCAFDNEKRRMKKIRVRYENICKEVIHIKDLNKMSVGELKKKLTQVDLNTLTPSERCCTQNLLEALHHKIHYENLYGKQRDSYLSSLNIAESEALFFLLSLKSDVNEIDSEDVSLQNEQIKDLKEQEEASRKLTSQAQELYEILKIFKKRGWITEELALTRSLRTGAPYVIPDYGQYVSCRRERESLQRRIVRILTGYM